MTAVLDVLMVKPLPAIPAAKTRATEAPAMMETSYVAPMADGALAKTNKPRQMKYAAMALMKTATLKQMKDAEEESNVLPAKEYAELQESRARMEAVMLFPAFRKQRIFAATDWIMIVLMALTTAAYVLQKALNCVIREALKRSMSAYAGQELKSVLMAADGVRHAKGKCCHLLNNAMAQMITATVQQMKTSLVHVQRPAGTALKFAETALLEIVMPLNHSLKSATARTTIAIIV